MGQAPVRANKNPWDRHMAVLRLARHLIDTHGPQQGLARAWYLEHSATRTKASQEGPRLSTTVQEMIGKDFRKAGFAAA